nr:hypothetical protein [Streptomyces sp. SID5468]
MVVLALLVVRQFRQRPALGGGAVPMLCVLAALGVVALVFGVLSVTKARPPAALTIALLVAGQVMAAGFGAARGATTRVWRDGDGTVLRQGTAATAVLWLLSIGAHIGLDAWIDHTTGTGLLGPATIYLYLAVTLGTQYLVVRRRAVALG